MGGYDVFCTKCGKKIEEGDLYCTKCGTKIENISIKENKTNEKIKNTKKEEKKVKTNKKEKEKKKVKKWKIIVAVLVILIIIVGIIVINKVNNDGSKESVSASNTNTDGETELETYELNKVGLFKGKNITDEKYNQNNDLISYKYLDNENIEQEIKFNYEYDSSNRVTKISEETGPYVSINYIEDRIVSIDNYFPGLLMRYTFIYDDNEYPKILKSTDFPNSDGILNFGGCILFEEKELNGKKYILTIETDENDKIISEKINLKEDITSQKIFDILEIVPFEYFQGELLNTEEDMRSIILDTVIDLDFGKIISHGKDIYSKENEKEQKNIYDNSNRILSRELATSDLKYFYKYVDINSKEYEYYCFAYSENKDDFRISDWTEEEIEKYGGVEQKYIIHKDENGNVTKIETLSNEEKIKREDINKKLQEYQEYVDSNKVDTSSLNFDNLKSKLEEMKNNGGIEYSISYNPLIDNKSEELSKETNENITNADTQTSTNSISDLYKEDEHFSMEDIEAEEEKIAKQEVDNANASLYIEYTKNEEGYYRSNYYDLIDDIQQINELTSNNEPICFRLSCNYDNYTVTIKETGKTYNSENMPNSIPFVEGKNTITIEFKNKYGYSKKISNTINVKKVGKIK